MKTAEQFANDLIGDIIKYGKNQLGIEALLVKIEQAYTKQLQQFEGRAPLSQQPLSGEEVKKLAERSSELQEGTYTPQHKITYKHGFIDGFKAASLTHNKGEPSHYIVNGICYTAEQFKGVTINEYSSVLPLYSAPNKGLTAEEGKKLIDHAGLLVIAIDEFIDEENPVRRCNSYKELRKKLLGKGKTIHDWVDRHNKDKANIQAIHDANRVDESVLHQGEREQKEGLCKHDSDGDGNCGWCFPNGCPLKTEQKGESHE